MESNDIDSINTGLYKLADFMKVDLPYSNTKEFCDYMDSEEVLVLSKDERKAWRQTHEYKIYSEDKEFDFLKQEHQKEKVLK